MSEGRGSRAEPAGADARQKAHEERGHEHQVHLTRRTHSRITPSGSYDHVSLRRISASGCSQWTASGLIRFRRGRHNQRRREAPRAASRTRTPICDTPVYRTLCLLLTASCLFVECVSAGWSLAVRRASTRSRLQLRPGARRSTRPSASSTRHKRQGESRTGMNNMKI